MRGNEEKTSASVTLLLVWGVTLFFTLYGARQLSDEIAAPWFQAAMGRLARLGDAIGLSHVRNGIEAVRERVNDDYLVLEPVIAPDVAEGVEEPIEEPRGALAHRAAPRKERILVVGASSIQFALGVQLEHALPTYQGVKAKRFGKLATGLTRPDFFDWPKKIDGLVRQFKPDLVIANFGGNCAQDFPVGDDKVRFTSKEWVPLYTERVQELVEIAKKHGADFAFIGMPNMRDPKFAAKMKRLNAVQRKAAEDAGALWISTWEMTSDAGGGYQKTIEHEGERGLMRAVDGVHYRTLGARYIVEQVLQELERHFLLEPADAALARAERHSFESKALGRTVPYVAFVPKSATAENRRPALYVAPGAGWKAWPSYPHRELQRLATEHGVVLVVLDPVELTAELFAEELVFDVEANLPVSDRRGLLGPELGELHVALDRLELAHTFKDADADLFNRSLGELISWHAEQLSAPVTRR